MSLTASATASLTATPKEVLEYVLDLNQYMTIDPKFVRVGRVVGPNEAGCGSVRLWGRMKGLPPVPRPTELRA